MKYPKSMKSTKGDKGGKSWSEWAATNVGVAHRGAMADAKAGRMSSHAKTKMKKDESRLKGVKDPNDYLKRNP